MIQTIFYWTGAFCWFIVALALLRPWHLKLMKWTPYGWIVESIIYPYAVFKLKRKLKLMKHTQIAQYWSDLRQGEYWWGRHWFGKKYLNIVEQWVLKTAPKNVKK